MNNLKMLVVDDESGMRLGTVKTLKNYKVKLEGFETEVGFDLSQAENGTEALSLLDNNSYDLLLLDYKLPDLTGLDILSHVNIKKYDILTIMITAYASLEVAISATKNGAYDFLAKPFTPQELKNVVEKAARHLLLKRQAAKLAEEKRQVRFQFLSVLSHELKAPLNAIEGYLRLLDERIAGDNIANYEKMVSRSLIRIGGMRKLIFDLLDLTRIESGQKTREIKPVDVMTIAEKAIETVTPAALERKIKIDLTAEDTTMLNADAGELEIIFNNLLSNAVKYNSDHGRVDVTITSKDDFIFIKVKDTGVGMTKEQVAKLFKEFVRFKNEKTRNVEGSGLGMSILKRLSSLYNGEIKVESEPDEGTEFTVKLQNAEEQESKDS